MMQSSGYVLVSWEPWHSLKMYQPVKPTFASDGKPTPNQPTINRLKENRRKGAAGGRGL